MAKLEANQDGSKTTRNEDTIDSSNNPSKSNFEYSLSAVAASTAAIGGALFSASAPAGILATDSVTLNRFLNAGSATTSSVAGAFDISAFIPSGATGVQVNSATIRAFGYSTANSQSSTSRSTSFDYYNTRVNGSYWVYYSRSGFWYYYSGSYRVNTYTNDYYYTATEINRFVDGVRDQMGLTVGSGPVEIDVVGREIQPRRFLYNYQTQSGSYSGGYTYTTVRRYDERDEWFGSLEILSTLQTPQLQDLSDGGIGFNVMAQIGQFTVTGLELMADISIQRTSPSGSVPLPTTPFLFLLGGLYAGAYRLNRARLTKEERKYRR